MCRDVGRGGELQAPTIDDCRPNVQIHMHNETGGVVMKKAIVSTIVSLLVVGVSAIAAVADTSPLGSVTGKVNVPTPNLPGSATLSAPRAGAPASGLALANPASAGGTATDPGGGSPVECNGAFTGVAPGDLVVEPGKFCIILGATVGNNVLVKPGAIGFHSHHSTIGGSVLSPGPIVFDIRVLDSKVGKGIEVDNTRAGTAGGICRSVVGGDIRLKNDAGSMNVGIGFPFDVCFAGNTVGGNIILDSNSGFLTVNTNHVSQSVHVDNNTGFEFIGPANVIAHTLECENNTPPPFSFGNVAANFVGQCQM